MVIEEVIIAHFQNETFPAPAKGSRLMTVLETVKQLRISPIQECLENYEGFVQVPDEHRRPFSVDFIGLHTSFRNTVRCRMGLCKPAASVSKPCYMSCTLKINNRKCRFLVTSMKVKKKFMLLNLPGVCFLQLA